MRFTGVAATFALAWLVTCCLGAGQVLAHDDVPVYTNDDLERMFGPPPPGQDQPIVSSTPEDWTWVESYLERQYARIDADREYELERRLIATRERSEPSVPFYGYAAFGLGYPASVWWNTVHSRYSGAVGTSRWSRTSAPPGPGFASRRAHAGPGVRPLPRAKTPGSNGGRPGHGQGQGRPPSRH